MAEHTAEQGQSDWPTIPDAEVVRRCSCGVYVYVEGTVPDPACPFHGSRTNSPTPTAEQGPLRLLELHGCEGGATAGYKRAGWHVTAVDTDRNRLRYNPADVTVVADAIEYVKEHGHEYHAVHGSPPCQWYTRGNAPRRGQETRWERTIPAVREAFEATGKPYVIENVKDAAWDLREPVTLCGCMFDLATTDTDGITIHLRRPRLFETSFGLAAPRACDHSGQEWVAGAYGGARRDKYEARYVRKGGYVPPDKHVVMALLGVEHEMTWNGLYECLPPAYTEHIGRALALTIPPGTPSSSGVP